MFKQHLGETTLSQGALLTFLADHWIHFKRWLYYIILNHSCDLAHKSKQIEYLLLVEAHSMTTEIIYLLEEYFNPYLNKKHKSLFFKREDFRKKNNNINTKKLYKHLCSIYEKIIFARKILDIDNEIWPKLRVKWWDLKSFLYFEYSTSTRSKFNYLNDNITNRLEKYLRFLQKNHISEDTDFSSSIPSTFFLYIDQEKTAIPDLLEVNFLKTLPFEMTEAKTLLASGAFEYTLKLDHPFKESFAKKFWDFFSRIALP